MTDDARRTGPAIEAHFQFLMWLVPAVEKSLAPRSFCSVIASKPPRSMCCSGPFMMSMVGAEVAPDTAAALAWGGAWAPGGAAGSLGLASTSAARE
jgi:hypothetical protein